jgi:hypothetical protein
MGSSRGRMSDGPGRNSVGVELGFHVVAWLVLVGESSEASAAMYAVEWGGEWDVAVVGRSSQTDPMVLVASAGVVVPDRGLQHVAAK